MGFKWKGFYYDETFAPIVKWASIKYVITFVANKQVIYYHVDVEFIFI
jgi:hypothetical protein